MPTYDYHCAACGGEFEAFQSMNDPHLSDCRLCHASGSVKRKIGLGAGIIFKGSGFYETDFKDKKGAKGSAEETSKTAEKAPASEASAGGEAKTGKKTEVTPSASTATAE